MRENIIIHSTEGVPQFSEAKANTRQTPSQTITSFMKITLSFFFILSFAGAYCQDSLKLKYIDAMVAAINASPLAVQRDTVLEQRPGLGLTMTKYLAMVIDNKELLKYVNEVITTSTLTGTERKITTSSSFYYEHYKVIKVEEYMIEDGKKQTVNWYYSDDQPLYYTLQSDKAEARAALLLTIANTMQLQHVK